MFKGYGDAIVAAEMGSLELYYGLQYDPIGTASNYYNAASNPGETWNAVCNKYSTLAKTDRGRGQITGEILIAAGMIAAGFASSEASTTAEIGRASSIPGKLFHYTSADPDSIMSQGLKIGGSGEIYATPFGDLSPIQAQLENALNPAKGLPIHTIEIDVAKCQSLGIGISGPQRVTGMVNGMPGGGVEYTFNQSIPSSALTVAR